MRKIAYSVFSVLNPNATAGPSGSVTSGTPAYSTGAADNNIPFTSGQPEPTTTLTEGGAGPAQSTAAASSSSTGAAMPMMTGAIGYGALLGAGAAIFYGA